jgi:hypothetical protein
MKAIEKRTAYFSERARMPELAVSENRIPAMKEMAIDKVRQLSKIESEKPQVKICTHHLIHAGMYARTIIIPKGVLLTGALIKKATILIVEGNALAYTGDDTPIPVGNHSIIAASANRKQAFYAREDTHLTMIFTTCAKDIEMAENEFTDEARLLFSRAPDAHNIITITGE